MTEETTTDETVSGAVPEPEKEVLTEVTSIAQEEAKTGRKINLPSAEDMNARANASFLRNMKHLTGILSGVKSNKRLIRIFTAILDLPHEGQSLKYLKDNERLAFAVGQSAINDRFLITQYHITQETKLRRKLNELQEVQIKAIAKLRKEEAPEEEIKVLVEKQRSSMTEYEELLRGNLDKIDEMTATKKPETTETSESTDSSETSTNEGEKS